MMSSFLKKPFWVWLDRFSWVLLVLVAPFLLFPTPARTLGLFVIPLLWFITWRSGNPVLPVTAFNGSLLVLSSMIAVSLWATYDISVSLPKLTSLLWGLAVFFSVARQAQKPSRLWVAIGILGATGLGMAGLGFLGTRWFTLKIGILDSITAHLPVRLTGLAGAESGFQPNEVAGALVWILPLAISLFVGFGISQRSPANEIKERRSYVILIVSTFVILLLVGSVFLLTQSRGGYIGLAVGLLFIAGIVVPRSWRVPFLALFGLCILIGGAIIAFNYKSTINTATLSNYHLQDTAFSLDTLQGRFEIWSRALDAIRDFPITGMGMNTFRYIVSVLYPFYHLSPDFNLGHAHNEFLQVALDLGLPGLIAFISLYVTAFVKLLKMWTKVRENQLFLSMEGYWKRLGEPLIIQSLLLGLAAGLFAHLIYGLTDAIAFGAKPSFIFWILLGLIAGLDQQISNVEKMAWDDPSKMVK